jgi:hypothetical protein
VSLVSGDRVKETTTTTGTGDLTLAGAVAAFLAFSTIAANADEFYYTILGGTDWEVGYGRWNTGGTLTRLRVLASSNGGALVNFPAGSKEVWCDFPSDHGIGTVRYKIQLMHRYLPPDTSVYVTDDYEIGAGKELEIGVGASLEVG